MDWKNLGLFGVIVADLVGFISAGIGLSHLLILKLHFPQLTYLFGAALGLILAFYQIYRISRKASGSDS